MDGWTEGQTDRGIDRRMPGGKTICLPTLKQGDIMLSMWMLILSYTIQQVIPNFGTKYKNRRCSSPVKSLITDEKIYLRKRTRNVSI